ncbi:vegetative cell wall protein gp1 (Hydroxyproline-richglycoprotein 1) [Nocardioidaceae bacterium Broad-1]|nr:vegetative cell wall protein gp1 (Hydroxyproline-richglycoprotein 1) [Nocardioidaceae bacterium Broad-1]
MSVRRLILFIAIIAVLFGVPSACIALAGRTESPTAERHSPLTIRSDHDDGRGSPSPGDVGAVAHTSNPESFAVSVAWALFDWDTTASVPLNDYTGRLLAVADPSGEESAGLVTDLSTYLPSPASWADLTGYRVRQWIDIDGYVVPDTWDQTKTDDAGHEIAAGTTAYTVTGLRRRSGTWQGKQAQTVDEVSFTIFMTCRPTYDTCKLLRLSQLNHPLP